MTNLLIVDDDSSEAELLFQMLHAEPTINIVGIAKNGEEAMTAIRTLKPAIVLLNLRSRHLNTVEVTRLIMMTLPVPVVVFSEHNSDPILHNAVEVGAVASLPKPSLEKKVVQQFIQTINLMSEIKVVTRTGRDKKIKRELKSKVPPVSNRIDVIAIGVSTGGPAVLQTILSKCLVDFPPILIVQHITSGFLVGLVNWLSTNNGPQLRIAEHGEFIKQGFIYIAPDDAHMGVDITHRIVLSHGPPINNVRPSISYLFKAVNDIYGKNAAGILLTGMGRDGAEELKLMKDSGAITLVQNKETSVVYGMPAAAVELGAADYVLSPKEIADLLVKLVEN